MTPIDLETLRRRPDVEAPELVAVDAADRLLLDTAGPHLGSGHLAVLNDRYGALTLGAAQVRKELLGAALIPTIRVFQDGFVHERALQLNAAQLGLADTYGTFPLAGPLLQGVSTVLLRLPRSLDELEELAWTIASHAPSHVQVLAAGRVKHMSLSMNAVLAKYFGSVTAGLARQKSRVLVASEPLPAGSPPFPRTAEHDIGLPRPLRVSAYGATFGGAALDPGTAMLLPHLSSLTALASVTRDTTRLDPDDASYGAVPREGLIDLGCGNGTISVAVALQHETINVLATDQSASAVASTLATAVANGVAQRIRVTRDDALSTVPDRSARSIVLNPPFHTGSTVHTGIAHRLFRECARVLRPGGDLLVVWNSHLRYRPVLERLVGPTEQLDRSPRFTVTRSVRR